MNILLVSSYLPYPLYSGGQVRLYNLIKELSKKHTITLICERRPGETSSDVKEVEKICKKVITIPRRKQWSLENIFRSGFSSHSFIITGHTLPEMQKKIAFELEEKKYDLIHVETFYILQNIPQTSVPIALIEHNIEYKVYERFQQNAPLPARLLLSIDIQKIRSEEERFWKRANALIAVSKDDQKVMKAAGCNATVVSNGVDTEKFSMKKKLPAEQKILFIGDFKWLQNRDSVSYIINDIWPKIKEQNSNVKLWIVARNIPETIKALSHDPDILFDEKSSSRSTEILFQEATVLLAPIRVGGGTSYKILESMSCGTPVVTMPLSANALEAIDGKHMLVGTNADDLAKKTVQVLKDETLYKHISQNGRKFIEHHYTWREIAKVLDEVYHTTKV